jgi:hypothetical protein
VKPQRCSVCGREPVEARGLCHAHYQRWRGGAPYAASLMRTQKNLYTHCTVDGCPNVHYAKGLCSRHYKRRWAGIPPDGATILGEAHPNAKLTEEMVRHIRTLRRDGASYTELAAMFGVSYDTVRGVITGRVWGHI